jgi:hypothetical protein
VVCNRRRSRHPTIPQPLRRMLRPGPAVPRGAVAVNLGTCGPPKADAPERLGSLRHHHQLQHHAGTVSANTTFIFHHDDDAHVLRPQDAETTSFRTPAWLA